MHEIIKYKLESMDAMSSNSRKSGRSIDIYMEIKYTHVLVHTVSLFLRLYHRKILDKKK